MALQKYHLFKRLAALELPKDALERRPERLRHHRIESLTPMRVARRVLHAVDGFHIALDPLCVKGEQ